MDNEVREDLSETEEVNKPAGLDMYSQFSTSKSLETKGVEIDYGTFRVTLARAGGSNKRYARVMEAKARPYRRAIATGTMDDSVADKLLYEVYAETIVLRWETLVDGEWKVGISPPPDAASRELLKFTVANLVDTFTRLPDLFHELREQATTASLFREELLEDDAKN